MTTTKTKYIELDITSIDPDPDNRNAVADSDFVASIKTHGVIEPVIVIEHPDTDGRYMLVAGERRWRGATKAKLTTIPTIVRHDLDAKTRIELAVVENLQRDDVPPGQEAMQLLRLVNVGHTIKTLAAAVGRNQKWVSQRLKLAELPKPARTLLDNGHWTLGQALEAVALVNHPEALDEVLALPADDSGRHINTAIKTLEFENKATKLIKAAKKEGFILHEDDTELTSLFTLGVDVDQHAAEPCHRIALSGNPHYGRPAIAHGCNDPKSHRKTGSSTVKATTSSSGRSETERANAREKREAKLARREAMITASSAKLPKTATTQLVYEELVSIAGAELSKDALRILDIELGKDQYASTILQDHANTSPAALQRAAIAIAMANRDSSIDRSWGQTKRAKTWLTWLRTHVGFKPSAYDRAQAQTKK